MKRDAPTKEKPMATKKAYAVHKFLLNIDKVSKLRIPYGSQLLEPAFVDGHAVLYALVPTWASARMDPYSLPVHVYMTGEEIPGERANDEYLGTFEADPASTGITLMAHVFAEK
jgi:hypothetical protein